MLEAKLKTGRVECGTDEAGRGCLAGPVTAAAIILPDDFKHPLLNDSKALTEKQRLIIEPILKEEAISYAVTHIGNDKIDKINILQASVLAMHRAIEKLDMTPEFISVDGKYIEEIGRASCRERVEMLEVAVVYREKRKECKRDEEI